VYLEVSPTGTTGIERYATMFAKERLVRCGPGASWAVMPGEGVTLVYWVFEAPACGELSMHSHPETQSGHVLDGEMTLRYADGTERTLSAGEFYTIPGGTLHGATVRGRVALIDVYTPGRPDYEERYLFSLRAKQASAPHARVSLEIR
jgi:quercetin dioxygenase-like cupin family protein